MSIDVRCTNILRFDSQQGKYVRCNHEFQVKEELAGQSVRCPQCSQSVVVSEAKVVPQAATSSASFPKSLSRSKGPAAENRQRVPGLPEEGLPPASAKLTSGPPATPEADDYPEVLDEDDEFRLLAPVELPSREFPTAAPVSQPPAASPRSSVTPPPLPGVVEEELPGDQKAPCPGCGNPLMARSAICPTCGYHKGLKRRVNEFETSDEDDKPTGFERWLRKQLAEGEDPGAIRSILIVGGLLLMTIGVVLFLMIGHLVWIFVGVAGILAAGAWLGWWKLDPWQWLLFANRMIGWRNPMPPFAHRKVLDLRNMPMGDGELGALKNLAEFDVIDLEGATVTDHGLPVLYDYRNLQFIILRDTQTTEDGARSLQQAIPSAWIWR
jgi:hypothetical protein